MNKTFEILFQDFEAIGQQAAPPLSQNEAMQQVGHLSLNELNRVLDYYTTSAVSQMALVRGIPTHGRNKKELTNELARRFYQPDSIKRILDHLSPEARDGLYRIKRAGGVISLVNWRTQMQARYDKARTEGALATLVAGTLALYGQFNYYNHGLLEFKTSVRQELVKLAKEERYGYSQEGNMLWSYPQVLDLVQPTSESQNSGLGAYLALAAPKIKTTAGFESLLADVIAFLRYIEQNRVKVLQSGDIGKRDFVKLNELMTVKEPRKLADIKKLDETGRLNFVWNLLLECQMVSVVSTPQGDTIAQIKPDHSDEFYALPRYRQARLLTGAWVRSNFNDFKQIPSLKFEGGLPTGLSDVPDRQRLTYARAQVMSRLEKYVRQNRLPTDQWRDFKLFVTGFRDTDPEFLVPRRYDQNPAHTYYGYESYYGATYYNGFTSTLKTPQKLKSGYRMIDGQALELEKDWELVEGEWLVELFAEPLAWLGMAELGLDANERPAAFRLTALGEAVLVNRPTEDEQAQQAQLQQLNAADPNLTKALLVQPNFDLMVLAPLQNMTLLRQIDRFADQTSLGDVAMYRISKDSALRGLRSGLSGNDLLQILDTNSRVPVAQNVAASIGDWSIEFERLILHENTSVLETPTTELLDRLLMSPQASQLIAKRLGPTFALIKGDVAKLNGLIGQLQGNFKMSPSIMKYDAIKPGSVEAEGESLLRVKGPEGNPYLYYRLGQFADLVEWNAAQRSAVFRLSAQAGQRAQALGLTYDQVSGFLQQRLPQESKGRLRRPIPLSAQMRLALRGWLGYYGAAMANRAILLRVTQRSQLDDIFELAEFGPALLDRSTARTALVRESHFPALLERLTALGMPISAPEFDPPTPIQVLPPVTQEAQAVEPEPARRGRKATKSEPKPVKPKETAAERDRRQREEQEARFAGNPMSTVFGGGGPVAPENSMLNVFQILSELNKQDIPLEILLKDAFDDEDEFPPLPPPRRR